MLLFVFVLFFPGRREMSNTFPTPPPKKKTKTSRSFTHLGQLSMAGFFIPSANLLKLKTFENYLGSADRDDELRAAWMTIFPTKSQVNEQSTTCEAGSFS